MIGTGALTGMLISFIQSIIYNSAGTLAVINLVTVILFTLGSPTAWGPVIVLSKLYANSMMVFLNDRIPSGHGRDDRATFGSMHFATLPGLADTAQERLNDARGSTPGQTTVPPKKHSCPA